MTLAFPDLSKKICVFKNASDSFYAGLVTQIHEEQLYPPMKEQDHQPLAFLSERVQRRATAINSTREDSFRYCRHSNRGSLPVDKS
jgi:hypothetical protein